MNKKLFAIPTIASLALSLAMPVFAETNTNTNRPTDPQVRAAITAAVSTCMQNAVEKRDTTVIGVVSSYSNAMVTALTTRKNSLKTAWGITDKTARQTALNTAWTSFRTSHREALAAKRTTRQAAWKTFRDDRKACEYRYLGQKDGSEGDDSQL